VGQIKPVTLLEAVVENRRSAGASSSEGIVLELDGGAKIDVRTPEQLRLWFPAKDRIWLKCRPVFIAHQFRAAVLSSI
jgi:hypothetical protein